MQIELRPITSIRPYATNPRCNDQAVDAVAASLKEFGFRQPIVVDEEGVIVVGHTRYKAALKLGYEKVPVPESLSDVLTRAESTREFSPHGETRAL
jgi:site-specific DNA-methyltransferase (adenine-specific)